MYLSPSPSSSDFFATLAALSSAKDLTFVQVQALLFRGLAIKLSEDVRGCEVLANSLLNGEKKTITAASRLCPYDYFTEKAKFDLDPCCNPTCAHSPHSRQLR